MTSILHTSFLHLNETLLARTAAPDYNSDSNETNFYSPQDDAECLYEETQLERARYEEEGFYDLEVFTHYLSGFGGLSLAIVGLVLNSFCAFTLCRAAVFRAHLVFLCAVAIADALQLSCLIVIITRDIRQPDPRYLNLLPRIYIRAFLYLYPLSKFFHLAMAWFVMAATIDCWRWIRRAQKKEEALRLRAYRRNRSMAKIKASEFDVDIDPTTLSPETTAKCRVIITEILALVAIALVALVYTIPAAWENKGDILLLGKIGTDTNCSAFIYHLMQTDISQTALYRIGYSLLGHLVFQTGIPLVASSIAIAKISRQLQTTSSSLGQLVTDAVQIVLQAGGVGDRAIPRPSYSQRAIVQNRNIIHCSLFLSVFTFYVCHVPQLWAKIQWSLMHVESHQNSHMKYVNEFVNFMTVANAAINGFFILCFCRRYIADGARDIDMCAWCFPPKDNSGPGLCKGSAGSDPDDDENNYEYDENGEGLRLAEGDDLIAPQDSLEPTYIIDNRPRICFASDVDNEIMGPIIASSSPDVSSRGPVLHSALRKSTASSVGNMIATIDGNLLPSAGHYYNNSNNNDYQGGYLSYATADDHNNSYQVHQQPQYQRYRHRSGGDYLSTGRNSDAQQFRMYDSSSNHNNGNFQEIPQQYYTMGPQDDEVYLAAQV